MVIWWLQELGKRLRPCVHLWSLWHLLSWPWPTKSSAVRFGKLKKKTQLEACQSLWHSIAHPPATHSGGMQIFCFTPVFHFFANFLSSPLFLFFFLHFLHFLTVAVGCCAPKVNGANKAGQTAKWNRPKWNGMKLVMDPESQRLEMADWQALRFGWESIRNVGAEPGLWRSNIGQFGNIRKYNYNVIKCML